MSDDVSPDGGPEPATPITRRELVRRTARAALSLASAAAVSGVPARAEETPPESSASDSGPYNILLILVDQERYFDAWPFPVPGRERLKRMGVSFDNHQIAANVCSPSRSVIYTGRHIQATRVFDNVTAPWQRSMSADVPTVGHMLREAGYHTAYKGKWHLSTELEEVTPEHPTLEILPDFLEPYGFSDYYGVGDAIGHARGGYLNDEIVGATAVRWLRNRGAPLAQQHRPWFLAVNLINPHDVMYLNTDRDGEPVQTANAPVMQVHSPPKSALYGASWEVPLPVSRSQSFDAPERPNAHREFLRSRSVLLGNWPDEDWRWRRLQDYYFNCIRDSDRHIVRILDELDDQGLLDRTIVVFTSDHGELGGAHQMHGKGACAYREQNHVPLIVAHPRHPGGRACRALSSHLDLAPTLLGLAGAGRSAARNLPGRDLSPLLPDAESAPVDAVRQGTLFNFNMFSHLDGEFLESLKAVRDARRLRRVAGAIAAIRKVPPALEKRGAIRSYFDGRYRFSRYFSPKRHHLPQTWDQLLALNDVELFDLENDPHELENLAANPARHRELLLDMNERLNALIREEAGEDNGDFLPLSLLFNWDLEVVDI